MVEEMLLAALHLFEVPDADFLVHLGDGAPEGLPLLQVRAAVLGGRGRRANLQYTTQNPKHPHTHTCNMPPHHARTTHAQRTQPNIDRSSPRAGFAVPKRAWADALGPEQLAVFAECIEVRRRRWGVFLVRLRHFDTSTQTQQHNGMQTALRLPPPPPPQARYPRDPSARAPKAVWRGTNTDRRFHPAIESNVLDLVRSRLHLMGRWYPHLLDAHYTSYDQQVGVVFRWW